MKNLIILVLVLLASSQMTYSFAQLYPGDVNGNGEVDNMDFLIMSTVFGMTGPPRTTPGTDWNETDYESWGDNLYNSDSDIAMADGNGDGNIDEQDIDVIYQNAASGYNVSAYPNPTSGMIYFDTGDAPVYSIVIQDQQGNLLAVLDAGVSCFDLSGLQAGYYYATFYDLTGGELARETISLF